MCTKISDKISDVSNEQYQIKYLRKYLLNPQRTQPLCLGCLQPTDLSCLCPVCKFPFCRCLIKSLFCQHMIFFFAPGQNACKMPRKLTAENVRWPIQKNICGFGHFPKLQFLLPTFSMWTEPPRIGLMIDPQNASAISTFLKVLVGSIIILPMKKVLAKCGGQVDFGEEGGSGWAQLVLPLRLLLFYKVGHRFFLLHQISLIYLIKYTRLVIGFFLTKVGDRWKLFGGIDADDISGSTKECSIGTKADDTHRGEGQFKMTL